MNRQWQTATDTPGSVLGQIGNRVQHALRAYTPADQKALNAAAKSFRINPAFRTVDAIQELGTGEALVSVLDENGVPSMVERANILPPRSSMSAVDTVTLKNVMLAGAYYDKYAKENDRESAYEIISAANAETAEAEKKEQEKKEKEKEEKKKTSSKKKTTLLEKTVNSTFTSMGRELGRKIVRGIFGNFFK